MPLYAHADSTIVDILPDSTTSLYEALPHYCKGQACWNLLLVLYWLSPTTEQTGKHQRAAAPLPVSATEVTVLHC